MAYIAGYQKVGGSTQADADAGALPPDPLDPQTTPNGAFEENRTVSSAYEFYSHEVQLKSIGTHPIDYIVGGYFSHEKNVIRFDVDIRNGYRNGTFNYAGAFIQADRTIESKAAFGQFVWHVLPHVRLTGGLRYTQDTKRDVGGRNVTSYLPTCSAADTAANGTCAGLFGIAPNDTASQLAALLGPNFVLGPNDTHGRWGKLTYLARADADLSPTTFVYGSISTGFKSGNIEDGGLLAGPESLTNYEVGLKQQFFGNRATLNLAAYYSDFKGYQVNQAVTFRNAAGQITGSQIITTNSKGATAKGIEAELAANFTPYDHLQIAANVQKTRFKQLLTVDGRLYVTSPANIENLEGNELAHAPRFAVTGTYIHDFELGDGARLSPRATVHYETASWLTYFNGDVASRYADPTHVNGNYGSEFDRQKAYTRLDLALSYTPANNRYIVEVFGQNVTNRRIRLSAGSFGAPANPVFLSNYAPPATYGGRVRLNF